MIVLIVLDNRSKTELITGQLNTTVIEYSIVDFRNRISNESSDKPGVFINGTKCDSRGHDNAAGASKYVKNSFICIL